MHLTDGVAWFQSRVVPPPSHTHTHTPWCISSGSSFTGMNHGVVIFSKWGVGVVAAGWRGREGEGRRVAFRSSLHHQHPRNAHTTPSWVHIRDCWQCGGGGGRRNSAETASRLLLVRPYLNRMSHIHLFSLPFLPYIAVIKTDVTAPTQLIGVPNLVHLGTHYSDN